MKEIPLITDVHELANRLGDSFLLFVGSAVSGVQSPHLPMTWQVLATLLDYSEQRLKDGSLYHRLAGCYAGSLVRGRYAPVLRSIKFESLLGSVEQVVGRTSLDSLLEGLYGCSVGESGANHKSIAAIIDSGRCSVCLTTNFDNCIELACPEVNAISHPARLTGLPREQARPVVLKLHGDAAAHSCVVTLRGLSEARQLRAHEYVAELLVGQSVLVLGYSALGDIDVAPHLRSAAESGARFYWAVQTEKSQVPEFAFSRVLCDLSAYDMRANLLFAIARTCGWDGGSSGVDHEWKRPLFDWIQSLDRDQLAEITRTAVSGHAGWPLLHLRRYVSKAAAPVDSREVVVGRECLAVAAYHSAGRLLRKGLAKPGLPELERLELLTLLGFTQWRNGELASAVPTLSEVLNAAKLGARGETVSDGCRIYLEVARDALQYEPDVEERRVSSSRLNLCSAMGLLESFDQPNLQGQYLTRLVVLDIKRLVGLSVNQQEAEDVFEECFAIAEWGIAEAAARSLVMLSYRDGVEALARIDRVLRGRRNWNTIRKSWAARLHARLGGRYPLVLALLDGPILASTKTRLVEARYALKRVRWDIEWRLGKTSVA